MTHHESSQHESPHHFDAHAPPRSRLSEEDLARITSATRRRRRWFDIGAVIAIVALAAFLLYEASSSSTDAVREKLDATSVEILSRLESLEKDTQKYDPIFRSTLLARTRSVLHGVRVTDIDNHATQSRLQEILVSLDRSGAFRNSGHGWLTLLSLLVRDVPDTVENAPYSDRSHAERLKLLQGWKSVSNSDQEISVVEQCYLDTFSSLLQLKSVLGSDLGDAPFDGLRPSTRLNDIAERLVRVARICPDIPIAHNALGVYWLERAERSGDSAQFDVAQRYFTYAFHVGLVSSVDRGLVFGTYANNIASVKIARSYKSTVRITRRDGDWYFNGHPDPSKLRGVKTELEEALLDLESTEGLNTSAAIHLLTRAELNLLLALVDRATKHPDIPISFDAKNVHLAMAMENLKQARYHGFEDWCYFFSKDWNKITVLATPALNAQVSGWCTF